VRESAARIPVLGDPESGSGRPGFRVWATQVSGHVCSGYGVGLARGQQSIKEGLSKFQGLSQGAVRRVTANAPGQRAQNFSLNRDTEKRGSLEQRNAGSFWTDFRRPPSHRWRKG
jgi:hypothetical protein